MNRFVTACAGAGLMALTVAGCHSPTYQPNANDPQLSAYAARDKYPSDAKAEMAPSLFYTVGDDGTITLYNASDMPLMAFDLWVNHSYVINVDKLPAKSSRGIAPGTVYNSGGDNLTKVDPKAISAVQVRDASHLWDVQGPVRPM